MSEERSVVKHVNWPWCQGSRFKNNYKPSLKDIRFINKRKRVEHRILVKLVRESVLVSIIGLLFIIIVLISS